MMESIAGISETFGDRFVDRLDALHGLEFSCPPVLLWNDAFFYNTLVSEGAHGFEITGVYDFQSTAYGSRELDIAAVEEGFRWQESRPNSKNREAYRDGRCLKEVQRGYEETSGEQIERSRIRDEMIGVIRNANQVRYYWDTMGMLHPDTPRFIAGVLDGLDSIVSCVEAGTSKI
jgi:aminoglycoside phosphotransferase (APT) family kinase protein